MLTTEPRSETAQPTGSTALIAEIATLRAQRDELLAALREIAAGDGIYGLQAREYKHIARAAVAKAEGRS